jgi:aerotaxis receptor
MRKNLPITDREVFVPEGTKITSKTDLKGFITYINADFLKISGFTKTELIGQPHNLIRHPDMPKEAFLDLWETVKKVNSWVGIVKNRCKNGDIYWVDANVSPIYENGKHIGYMSVRTMATKEQIQKATQLYNKLNSGVSTKQKFDWFSLPFVSKQILHFFGSFLFLISGLVIGSEFSKTFESNILLHFGFGCGFLAILVLGYLFFVSKKSNSELSRANDYIQRISTGKLKFDVEQTKHREFSNLFKAIKSTHFEFRGMISQLIGNAEIVKTQIEDLSEAVIHIHGAFLELSKAMMALADSTIVSRESSEDIFRQMEDLNHLIQAITIESDHVKQESNKAYYTSASGKLAEQSSRSAKEISSFIADLTSKILQTVDEIQDGLKEVEQGSGDFETVHGQIDQILKNVAYTKESAVKISSSTEESKGLSGKVLENMDKIQSQLTDTSAIVEELSAAATEQKETIGAIEGSILALKDVANRLDAVGFRFKF